MIGFKKTPTKPIKKENNCRIEIFSPKNKKENKRTKIGEVNNPAPASAIGIIGITLKYNIIAITLKMVLNNTIFIFFGIKLSLK